MLLFADNTIAPAKETGNYADDFVEETGSDYSDDFDEAAIEAEIIGNDDEARNLDMDEKEFEIEVKNGNNKNLKDNGVETEYPDDFEEIDEDDEQVGF